MADQEIQKTTTSDGNNQGIERKPITEYSKMSQEQYGYSTNFKRNMMAGEEKTPKMVTIGRLVVGLSAIFLIWTTYRPFYRAAFSDGQTETGNFLSGDGILIVLLALLACIIMVFRKGRKFTIIFSVLTVGVVAADIVFSIYRSHHLELLTVDDDVTVTSYKLAYGAVLLAIGAAVMLAGSLMILITDIRMKKKTD